MTPNARAIVRTLNTVLKANSTMAPSKTKLILSKVPVNAYQTSARRSKSPVRIWIPSISLEEAMISGAHVVVYSKDADADRAFFRDVLGFKSVDAGHGWLIFALPPGEVALHPSEENGLHELYFMCEDLKAEMASLATKDVKCSKVEEARWGLITKMRLPGGGEVGLYQPNHPTALGLK
jgi:catechol 2,3-dioxygenase-like lactoylglutathione lyase family enzyme